MLWTKSKLLSVKLKFKQIIYTKKSVEVFNKTPGYHRNIFRASILLKMPLQRMKAFCFKKYSFFIIFSNFSKIEIFLIFFAKNSKIKVEKALLENIIVWYAFYSKFSTFNAVLKNNNFFLEKPNFF